ncbi:MAG: sensor protein Chase2, partial [Leptolyngbyaceae cyanobacterium SL_7_1]|nr:sensor protein Chase2 [Leptolyngbyaceae cyanobacterium SL_7_1]
MATLVILDLAGDLHRGVNVTLDLHGEQEPALRSIARTRGSLPPASELGADYQQWQALYRSLSLVFRLGEVVNPMPTGSQADLIAACNQAARQLAIAFNQWLSHESFRPIWEQCLVKLPTGEPIRWIVQTEDI